MQCFICQVCLANDLFLLFESIVSREHGMLDGSSRDEPSSCIFECLSKTIDIIMDFN